MRVLVLTNSNNQARWLQRQLSPQVLISTERKRRCAGGRQNNSSSAGSQKYKSNRALTDGVVRTGAVNTTPSFPLRQNASTSQIVRTQSPSRDKGSPSRSIDASPTTSSRYERPRGTESFQRELFGRTLELIGVGKIGQDDPRAARPSAAVWPETRSLTLDRATPRRRVERLTESSR